MGRSILSVIGGYLTLIIGVSTFFGLLLVLYPDAMPSEPGPFAGPTWILIAELGTSGIVAVFGGYVSAWIANHHHLHHAAALAALMLVLGVVSMALETGMKPLWSSVAIAVVCPAAAVAGGALRVRLLRQ